MPIGRASDAKAPASGYTIDAPQGWLPRREVTTALAGLNFGPRDGLVGIDLDFKPDLAPDENALTKAKNALGDIARALPGIAEVSWSGKGLHIFAWGAPDLLEWIGTKSLQRIVIAPGVPRPDGKAGKRLAAVEVFGGGNAQIAVSERWVRGRAPTAEPLPVLDLAALRDAVGEAWQAQQAQPRLPESGTGRRPQGRGGAERLDELLSALRAAGHEVSRAGAEGAWAASTALCHGGDSAGKLWLSAGERSVLLHCYTAGCTDGREGHRAALEAVYAAAGLELGAREQRERYALSAGLDEVTGEVVCPGCGLRIAEELAQGGKCRGCAVAGGMAQNAPETARTAPEPPPAPDIAQNAPQGAAGRLLALLGASAPGTPSAPADYGIAVCMVCDGEFQVDEATMQWLTTAPLDEILTCPPCGIADLQRIDAAEAKWLENHAQTA